MDARATIGAGAGSDRCTPSCTAPAAPSLPGAGETVGIAGLTLAAASGCSAAATA